MKKILIIQVILCLSIMKINAQTPHPCGFEDVLLAPVYLFEPIWYLDIPEQEQSDETPSEFRRLHWVHGLGGNASALSKIADACENSYLHLSGFPARKVYSSSYDYQYFTFASLTYAAKQVGDDIKKNAQFDAGSNVNPNKGILLGHSQGAVVGRDILHRDLVLDPTYAQSHGGRGYGGFVSIAGPLQGAMILNNRQAIQDMASDACRRLAKGYTDGTNAGQFINIILTLFAKKNLGDIRNQICQIVGDDILPLFFSKYYDGITNDYLVGSNYLNILNADANNSSYRNFPKVAFYGIEPSTNIFWRTANWLKTNPNTKPHFGANSDFDFYKGTIEPMYLFYKGNYENYKRKYDAIQVDWRWMWLFPVTGLALSIAKDSYRTKYLAWQDGKEWFEGANAAWETIIGARTIKVETTRTTGQPYTGPSSTIAVAVTDMGIEITHTEYGAHDKVTIVTTTIENNDGIVLQSSAANLPCATAVPVMVNPRYSDANGSSHMQIRNDKGIRDALLDLFEGKYGRFFETKEW